MPGSIADFVKVIVTVGLVIHHPPGQKSQASRANPASEVHIQASTLALGVDEDEEPTSNSVPPPFPPLLLLEVGVDCDVEDEEGSGDEEDVDVTEAVVWAVTVVDEDVAATEVLEVVSAVDELAAADDFVLLGLDVEELESPGAAVPPYCG